MIPDETSDQNSRSKWPDCIDMLYKELKLLPVSQLPVNLKNQK